MAKTRSSHSSENVDEVVNLLKERDFPILVDEIISYISDNHSYPKGNPKAIYHPGRAYKKGDKLYHPAEKFQAWFEVIGQDDETINVLFEDGGRYELVHNMDMDAPNLEQKSKELELNAILEATNEIFAINDRIWIHEPLIKQVPFNRVSCVEGLEQLLKLRAKHSPVSIDELRSICNTYSLSTLYYLTPIENIRSILSCGILAKNFAPEAHESFACKEIQVKRDQIVPRKDLCLNLHDFVPLFFAPSPPLIYRDDVRSHTPIYLEVNPIVLRLPGTVFSNVNASSKKQFFTDVRDLCKLNWSILKEKYWSHDDPDIHRRNKASRQAEVNIPITIDLDKFLRISVQSRSQLEKIKKVVDGIDLDFEVRIKKDYYQ